MSFGKTGFCLNCFLPQETGKGTARAQVASHSHFQFPNLEGKEKGVGGGSCPYANCPVSLSSSKFYYISFFVFYCTNNLLEIVF